ncbi:MAG: IS3 family transposase, partial [Desulfovibrio sp.]|nr:IS3 family transposase [Desulfovibrio sp.]
MTLGVSRSTVRRPPPQDRDAGLRRRLRELAEERRRFGVQRLHVLLRREGLVVNHKRTERLYREESLSLRLRPKRKRPSVLRSCLPTPLGPDEQWGMDFVSDSLESGRRIRILTILDL